MYFTIIIQDDLDKLVSEKHSLTPSSFGYYATSLINFASFHSC